MMRRALPVLLSALLAAVVGVPLVTLLTRAALQTDVSWWSVWSSPEALNALRGTLLTSCSAAALAFGLGFPIAVLVGRTDLPFAKVWRAAFTLPSALPPFILGMGWVCLANPKAGLLNTALGLRFFDIYGPLGISFVLGTAAIPLVFLPTLAALARLDSSLEEAARMSGASALGALRSVSVPLALPAGLSGASLALLFAASAFGVPYLLGVAATPPTPTLTTRIYSEILMGPAGLNRAAMLSCELLVLAAVVLWGSRRLSRAGQVRLSSGKGLVLRPLPLGQLRVPLGLVSGALAIIVIVLPLLAVALTSVEPVWGQLRGLTVRHWSAVLSSPRTLDAAVQSVVLSFAAATLVTGLGLAFASTKKPWLETLGGAAYAIPGTVLALALVVAYSRDLRFIAFEKVAFVLALGNSLWLLLMAYAAKHLAFGVRNAADGLAQVDPSLEEAARLCGANAPRAFVDGVLPQLRSPLAAAFLVTFLTCMTELTLSVLLVPTGRDVLGTLLFDLQSYADPGSAAVIASAFVGLVLVAQATQALTRREAR